MENTENQQDLNASATRVYELPGEPAIVINGVPDVIADCGGGAAPSPSAAATADLGFGEWFVGREIRKLFMGKCYKGTVTEYDKESGWYRILYEDGDAEDLDWKELEEVLLPMDVAISLKALTQKVIKKNKKPVHKSGKNEDRSQNPKIKKTRTKGK